jgi:hypothetical protein
VGDRADAWQDEQRNHSDTCKKRTAMSTTTILPRMDWFEALNIAVAWGGQVLTAHPTAAVRCRGALGGKPFRGQCAAPGPRGNRG